MCVKGSLVLVLVLDCTQYLPQEVGAPPAMQRGCTAGFPPKNWVAGIPERRDRWIYFAVLSTGAHQPREGCIHLVQIFGSITAFTQLCRMRINCGLERK